MRELVLGIWTFAVLVGTCTVAMKGPIFLKNQPSSFVSTPMTLGFGVVVALTLRVFGIEVFLYRFLSHVFSSNQLVALFVVLCGALNAFCAGLTAHARSKFSVPLPFVYPSPSDIPDVSAAARHEWLCVVRVHENFLEFLPQMLAISFVSVFICKHEYLGPVLGLVWILGRFLYAVGYSSGFPQRRLPGLLLSLLGYFTQHGLVICWIFLQQ